jgi:DNA gyrase subunit A
VIGIRLEEGDACRGGALFSNRFDKLLVETTHGHQMEFGPAKYEVTSRGGKGFEALKRSGFVRVVPPPIQLVDWNTVRTEPSGNETADG